MGLELEDLKAVLLDLLSTERHVATARVSSLTEEEWSVLLSMARQHRLAPLLNWRLAHEKADVAVPGDVGEALAGSFKTSALRALVIQRELVRLRRILGEAGIPCVALKGADLAFSVYPHPALRPLRDLDVLVAKERALDAYQALIAGGYRRLAAYPGDPQASIAVGKHLPALRSASGQLLVELHVRLIDPDPARVTAFDESGLWGRLTERTAAGASISYLSATDLLLHLAVHAVYDHRFINGPLVISDVSFLVRGTQIDWPLFWRLADEGGWTRGCLLLLELVQGYCGELPVDVPESACSEPGSMDALVATCSSLMLSDLTSRDEILLAGALAGRPVRQQLSILLRKAVPPRAVIAANYPAADHPLGVYFGYLSKFATRVPQILASRRNAAVRSGAVKMAELDRWLTP